MSQLQVTGEAKIRDIQGPVVANSGVITALDGAASQYVRGDGTLADFPTSTGGGSSVSYYLNSSVSQGTIGGVAYRELSKEPIIGAGTDITISANGYVASYITDANDPDVLSVPGGNFNCEFYFSVNNNTGNPTTYAELYKYDGTTFTLLGSSQAVPESLNQGTTIAPYYFAIPVATAALALTDRLAIRIYVSVDGRVVTLHTENSHLCQVVTTFSKGMVSLNNLTDQSQFITTGTSGTNFNIVSSGDTHTFNLPVASATNTGKLSNTDWSTFNAKQPAGNYVTLDTTQTITAAKTISGLLTVNNKIYLQTDLSTTGVYLQSYNSNEFSIGVTSGATTYYSNFILQGANRNYTFPNIDGTIALTSNLSSYVPYTGATTNVDLGNNDFTALGISGIAIEAKLNGTGSSPLILRTGTSGYSYGNDSISLISSPTSANTLTIISDISSVTKIAQFGLGSLTATRTFTLPDLSGTLALTSQLTGGTVTSVGLSSSTSGVTIGSSPITTSGTITLSIATASGSQNGLLSSTDWTTFNGKQAALTNPITGTGTRTINYLPIFSGSDTTIANSAITDDGTTVTLISRALSGTSATFTNTSTFRATGNAYTNGSIILQSSSGATSTYLTNSGGIFYLSNNGSTDHLQIASTGAATFSSSVQATNMSIGIAPQTDKLFVYNPSGTNTGITIQQDGTGDIFRANGNGGANRFSITQSGAATFNSNQVKISNSTGTALDMLVLETGFSNPSGNKSIIWKDATSPLGRISVSYNASSGGSTMTFGSLYNGGYQTSDLLTIAPTGAATFSSSVTTGSYFQANDGTRDFYFNPAADFGSGSLPTIQVASNHALQFATNNSLRMTITSSGNVGIGTSSPLSITNGTVLHINGNTSGFLTMGYGGTRYLTMLASSGYAAVSTTGAVPLVFETNETEKMRITSDGRFLVGANATDSGCKARIVYDGINQNGLQLFDSTNNTASTIFHLFGINNPTPINIGSILRVSNTNAVSFSTTSDYRLKEDLKEINGLEKVLAIKVYDFKWKGLDSRTDGVIAHELQEILPYAVNGEKDGLDKNGNPSYQGVDYSKIVPILVKAIQEQQAQIEELKALINK